MLVNSQMVCILSFRIFKPIVFIWYICFLQFGMLENSLDAAKRIDHYKHLTIFPYLLSVFLVSWNHLVLRSHCQGAT